MNQGKQTPYDYVLARARFKDRSFCIRCLDVGIVRVQVGDVGTLAKCRCEQGHLQIWNLPFVPDGLPQRPVPVEQFTPPKRLENSPRVMRFIRERISWWKEKIFVAEEFWRSQSESGETNGKLQTEPSS